MTPPLVVAACAVVMSWYTTHGWRPTSVTIQPHSIATSAAGPQSDPEPPEPGLPGQAAAPPPRPAAPTVPPASSTNASPTMASKDRWIRVSAGGRSAASHRVQPGDLGMRAEADQQRVGVRNRQAEVDVPVHVEAAEVLGHAAAGPGDVLDRGELDRLLHWRWPGRRCRRRRSEWESGSTPMVNGIPKPSRWYRSRRPCKIPAAYTAATMNPTTM